MPGQTNSGAVYTYELLNSVWTNESKLSATSPNQGDLFGEQIDLMGDSLVISASGDDEKGDKAGAAYLFERITGNWVFNE